MGRLKTLKPRIATLKTDRVAPAPTFSDQRIRGRKLQRIRDRYLSLNPLCKRCMERDRVTAAAQVDHIVALVNAGEENEFDDSNRQGLCIPCHAEKTAEDMARRTR